MKRIAIVAVLLVALLLPGTVLAQEEAGTISGQVVNHTAGGGSVAGAGVTLLTYVDGQLADMETISTDDDGGFAFADIDLANEYYIAVSYQQVDYYYQVAFDEGETETYIEAGVCEVSDDDAQIYIAMTHIAIDVAEDALEVTQVYYLVNEGDTTFINANGGLDFTLPEGATDFAAPDAYLADFILTEDNLAVYLVPFPPGERQLYFGYRLPLPGEGELTLTFYPDYQADIFDLMVGGDTLEVASGQLTPTDPVVTDEGARYIHFRGENLPQYGAITVYLTDTSRGGFPLYIIWIVLAVIAAAAAAYLLWRRRRRERPGE